MGTTEATIYARAKSGFVRLFNPYDHFMYNILIMVILTTGPWLFLQAPFAFPGGDMALGIIICGVLGTAAIALYSMLASAMPVSGGDYVYNSRILHPSISFALNFTAYPLFSMYWNAMAGWTIAQQGINPLLTFLGYNLNNATLISWGAWFGSVEGYILVATISNFTAFFLLLPGLKPYIKYVNPVLFAMVILTMVSVGIVFAANNTATFVQNYNAFMSYFDPSIANHYQNAINVAAQNGFDSATPFSWYNTLGIITLAWYYLAWAQMATPNMGEIKGAEKVKRVMLVNQASLWFGVIYTVIVALQLLNLTGPTFLKSFSYSYYMGLIYPPVVPFYVYWACLLTASPVVLLLCTIGFLANAWQLSINCYICNSRFLAAQGFDRILPAKFSEMGKRFRSTPVYAMLFMLIGTEFLIFTYQYITRYTLSQMYTFAFLFLATSIAAIVAPWRISKIWNASPGSKWKIGRIQLLSICGVVATIFFLLQIYFFSTVPGLFLADPLSIATMLSIIATAFFYYWIKRYYLKRKAINIDLAFKEIPPE